MVTDEKSILQKALKIRRFEELVLEEYKKGKIFGTVHTCIGQEVFPVVLNEFTSDYFWFSNHRGHGHYLSKTNDFEGLFAEIFNKEGGIAKGFGGSQHLYNDKFMSNGIQGGQAGIAVGYSSNLLDNQTNKSVMFLGDGTLGVGHIYEAFNLASIYKSQIIFVLEDNNIAQSTPSDMTFNGDISNIIKGFNLSYLSVDGNDINSINNIIAQAVALNNKNKPVMIHVKTNRLSSHSKGDDNRSEKQIRDLEKNDLLLNSIKNKSISYGSNYIKDVEKIYTEVINRKDMKINTERTSVKKSIKTNPIENDSYKDNINKALDRFLSENENGVLIGEDIIDDPFKNGKTYGGAFKVTKGLSSKYEKRVVSTPISESGFTGFAVGLALRGEIPIVEIMFSDFLSQTFDQIFHQISKIPSIYGQDLPLKFLIRTAAYAGNGYGPTHSTSLENYLIGLPNIDIFVPSLFTDYSSIVRHMDLTSRPTFVFEVKSNYTKKMSPKFSEEYDLKYSENGFNLMIQPKNYKPSATVFVYGPELDLVLNNLDKLAKENEIFVNIFSPVFISSYEKESINEILNYPDPKIISISQNINLNNISNFWIGKYLENKQIKNYKSLVLQDWVPTGANEKEVLPNYERLLESIKEL
jgi:2-oxoisovalerate dehydrogenase E1 component